MAKKVTVSDIPDALFIDNAAVLRQLARAKRRELGIKLALTKRFCYNI